MLFTFPSRYWYTIGQTGILRLPPRSGRIHTGFHEARATRDTATTRPCAFGYGAITLYGQAFNPARLTRRFVTRPGPVGDRTHTPATPHAQPPTGITRHRFSHHPLSLATTHGVSFPAGTEMFHFPAYPPHQGAVTAHDGCRVSPFRNPRIKARSAAPRGLSQLATSFIA